MYILARFSVRKLGNALPFVSDVSVYYLLFSIEGRDVVLLLDSASILIHTSILKPPRDFVEMYDDLAFKTTKRRPAFGPVSKKSRKLKNARKRNVTGSKSNTRKNLLRNYFMNAIYAGAQPPFKPTLCVHIKQASSGISSVSSHHSVTQI